jgi:SAM-dependent MidA family methyltransferase
MHSADSRLILPEPPEPLKALSRSLVTRMRERWSASGRLSFADYMEMALYEPGLGYYSAGLPKLGEAGDFVTAPELGSLFARCLARQAADVGEALEGRWDVLEIGAGTGRLAADFLTELAATNRSLPVRYRILERSADLRAEQERTVRERAPEQADRVEWLDTPPAEPWQGVLLANEVVDALAVERFRIRKDGVEQLGVRFGEEGLTWDHWPAPEQFSTGVLALQERLAEPLSPGYTSEWCATLPAWLSAVTASLDRGMALFADYGYPRDVYYHPERREGTLVCQYRHRAHFDPFHWPGLQDLSAFVDFTALAEASDATGLEVAGYAPQNQFLLGCGLEQLAGTLPDLPPQARQALAHELRELTLPGAMGEKFQLMALTRALDLPLRGFRFSDWRDRL